MATNPPAPPGGIVPSPTRPSGSPRWVWGFALAIFATATLLWWQPWTGMANSTSAKLKATPIPVTVQLKREHAQKLVAEARARKAEAKVAELRRALRAAKARPVRTVGGSQTLNVKHSGKVELGGEVRFLFGSTPSFPVIPPPPGAK